MAEPYQITQGTVVEWTRAPGEYPTSTHSLAYAIRGGPSDQTAAVTVTEASGEYSASISAAVTAALVPGAYLWQAFATVTATGARTLIDSGIIQVLPDLANAQPLGFDARSPARQRLENLNAMLANVAILRTLQPDQIETIERVRKQAEWDCKREDDAAKLQAGEHPTRKILTRFAS